MLYLFYRSTFYVEQHSAWIDIKTKLKVADLDLFKRILKAVSVPGLVGLDRIVSFVIAKQLQVNQLHFVYFF